MSIKAIVVSIYNNKEFISCKVFYDTDEGEEEAKAFFNKSVREVIKYDPKSDVLSLEDYYIQEYFKGTETYITKEYST